MRLAMLIMSLVSVALLFLLTQASANTDFFARHYFWLVGLNVALGLAMAIVIGVQLYRLWRDHREQIFGARLKFRLMLMLALMVVPLLNLLVLQHPKGDSIVPNALCHMVDLQHLLQTFL